jgi:hypothetical protein
VHDDIGPAFRQAHRGRKAGKSRADHMDRARHQMKAYRRMIHTSRERGRRIGRRG